MEQTAVANVVANHVTFDRQSFAGVVIARSVEGNVRTLLDWKGALAGGRCPRCRQRGDGGGPPPLTGSADADDPRVDAGRLGLRDRPGACLLGVDLVELDDGRRLALHHQLAALDEDRPGCSTRSPSSCRG